MMRVRSRVLGTLVMVLAGGCSGPNRPDEPLAHEQQRLSTPPPLPTQVSSFALLSSGHVTLGDRMVLSGGHLGVTAGAGDSVTEGSHAVIALGKSTLGQRVVLKDRTSGRPLHERCEGHAAEHEVLPRGSRRQESETARSDAVPVQSHQGRVTRDPPS